MPIRSTVRAATFPTAGVRAASSAAVSGHRHACFQFTAMRKLQPFERAAASRHFRRRLSFFSQWASFTLLVPECSSRFQAGRGGSQPPPG